MVRSEAQLVERMALVWHDWFATRKAAATQGLMLRQNALLRRHALGSFEALALAVTRDAAMLLWLNGVENRKDDVNENYGTGSARRSRASSGPGRAACGRARYRLFCTIEGHRALGMRAVLRVR